MASNNETSTVEIPQIDTFDLPNVTGSAPAKPRVHDFSSSACVGCEG
jgi:hypothetical protein